MKEKIIETALQQFKVHGIQKVTIENLVSDLGISTKTMDLYFANKEELIDESLKIYYKESDKFLSALIESSPNTIAAICNAYSVAIDVEFGRDYLFLEDINYYYPALQDKAIKEYTGTAFEILTGLINKATSEGYFMPFLDPTTALEALSTIFKSVTRYDAYKDFDKKGALVKRNMATYIRSICTDRGLQEMSRLNLLSE